MLSFALRHVLIAFGLGIGRAAAQFFTGPQDPRITTAFTLDVPTTGVSTTPDGRMFLVLARLDGSKGAQIVEYHRRNGSMTPCPDVEWNSYADGKDPATHRVRINSQRIGPDGHLYLVDVGSPSFGQSVIFPSGPRLIQIDIKTNTVCRVYSLSNATRFNSLLDDVRFHAATGKAYITDAGSPGLIILDPASGMTRRVLDDDRSTTVSMPVSGEGRLLFAANSSDNLYVHADQLEISPDGEYLYFQPASSGMSRIETKYMDEAFYNSSLAGAPLSSFVKPSAQTPGTGGTAIDADGNIYVSDANSQRIIRIAPDGTMALLVQDPRLLWIAAMWVDSHGKLWMPAAQLNRGVPFGNGESNITKPLSVFTIDSGIGPSLIDHA